MLVTEINLLQLGSGGINIVLLSHRCQQFLNINFPLMFPNTEILQPPECHCTNCICPTAGEFGE
jgi:hypothetical protein